MAAAFKVAFTHEDAPELLDWTANKVAELTTGFSLVTRARGVFIGIALALAQVIGAEYLSEFRRHRFGMFRLPYIKLHPLTIPQHQRAQSTISSHSFL